MAKEHVVLDSLGNSDGNLPCQMDVEYPAKEARGDCSAAYSRESRPESCLCEIQVKKDGPGIRYASRVLASGFLSLIQDEILQLMRILCLSGWVDIEFEEPWSQPGFLQMTVISGLYATCEQSHVKVLKAFQGLLKDNTRVKPTLALSPSRRCLIQPVVKV